MAIGSDRLRDLMKLIEQCFPRPRGFEGNHYFVLGDNGHLQLGIWYEGELPGKPTLVHYSFDEGDEVLNEETFNRLKEQTRHRVHPFAFYNNDQKYAYQNPGYLARLYAYLPKQAPW
jgi:hypothetical protein